MIKYIALAILLVFVASTEGDELSRNEQWFSIPGNKERALWGLERGQLYRIIELLGNLSKYLRWVQYSVFWRFRLRFFYFVLFADIVPTASNDPRVWTATLQSKWVSYFKKNFQVVENLQANRLYTFVDVFSIFNFFTKQ